MSAENKDEDRTPAEIEADIAETREDLGDTVAQVADKADVKKQAKKKTKKKVEEVKAQAAEIKETAADKVDEAKKAASAKVDETRDKAGDARDVASDKAADVKERLPDEFEGSAGDIGSGPTGDIHPNDAVGAGRGLADNPLVLVAAAFVVGLAIGRWTAR